MELTRVKPFGKRRKTYFYGVAGTVLAAHVVVGAIIHVMPPELEEAPPVAGVQMQIVDYLLPDDVVESSAVRMVEDAVRGEIELPVFEPVWEPDPIEPELEPIGPTESVLPESVVEMTLPTPGPDPVVTPVLKPALFPEPVVEPTPVAVSKPPVKPAVKTVPSKPAYKAPPVKKKAPVKTAYRPPVKKKTSPPPAPKPEPVVLPEPKRAVPVAKPTGGTKRRGLLDRNRTRSAPKPEPAKYVQASWSKRPPPFYPNAQRQQGIEGTAHVRVSISSSGRITSARLVKSTGNSALDKAALSSVKKGSMNPARRGGRSVSSEMIVPFEFYR